MTIPEQHQLKIAWRTLRMPDALVQVMGGMTKKEAAEIIEKYEKRMKKSRRKNDRK